MSLQSLIREHQTVQSRLKEVNEQRKKKATESMQRLSHQLVLQTNRDTVEIFHNQQTLENEAKNLHQQTQRFVQRTQKWMQSFSQLNDCLKELGDVENWASIISADVEQVVKSVDEVLKHRQQQQQQQQQQQL